MVKRKSPKLHLEDLFDQCNIRERERKELISVVCKLHCEGHSGKEITEAIRERWPALASLMTREDPHKIIRAAASDGLLFYQPPFANDMVNILAGEYQWNADRMSVVLSPVLEHVARETAKRLVDMIFGFESFGRQDTVHIGFAGGRLLRCVAQELAKLLRKPVDGQPKKIVFHAMVAAFSDDDFEADPNNFITYFIQEPLAVDIGFVPMAAPGIVESRLRPNLREFREIKEVFHAASKLDIIVSSAGDWMDEHSTAQAYLKEVEESDVDQLNAIPAIGDLLWQPISEQGPIDMDNGDFTFRPNTLLDLDDLPAAIGDRKVRVLLALGPCGKCGKPKGKLLDSILNFVPALVTDVVTNSPTVYDALNIARRRKQTQAPSEIPRNPK